MYVEDKKWKWERVRKATHLRLVKIKEREKHGSVGSTLSHVLDVYEGRPKVTIMVGTCQVWSRSV